MNSSSFMNKARSFMKRKQVSEIIWNYFSLIILSLSGVLYNVIITIFYGPEVLGVYNQGYAWYVAFSQITVFGIHMSITRYASELFEDHKACAKSLVSSIVSVVCISIASTVLLYFISNRLTMSRPELNVSLKLFVLSLPFFSINKVILGFVNGLSRMKMYAILQSLRYILILIALFVLACMHAPGRILPVCFVIAETILLLVSVLCVAKLGYLRTLPTVEWIKTHFRFGLRIIPSNFAQQLNPQVDVLCLSLLLQDDYKIGIYSFAILFVEGFYQVFMVLRRNLNPKLTVEYFAGSLQEFWDTLVKKFGRVYYLFAFLAYVALLGGYALLCYIIGKPEYLGGLYVLVIIAGSMAFNAKSILLGNLFSQIGKPILESYANLITVSCNFVMNFVMILIWGCYGAAIASAISYFAFRIALHYFAKRNAIRL